MRLGSAIRALSVSEINHTKSMPALGAAGGQQCQRPYGHSQHPDDAIDHHRLATQQVLPAFFAVVAPPQNGGEGKQHCRQTDEILSEGYGGSKRHGSQVDTSCTAAPGTGGDYGQTGDGADDEGVDECAEHGDGALLDRVIGLGRGVGDGGAAEAGFVGEHTAGDAEANGGPYSGSGKTTGGGLTGEGAFHHQGDGGGDFSDIEQQHQQADGDIENGHERHQPRSPQGDALDAAEQHGTDQHHERYGGDQRCDVEFVVEGGGDGVGLHHIADAETGDGAEDREGDGEPAPFGAQAVADVVHGAADPVAGFVFFAELHGADCFGIFGGHADQSCHPHPEQGSGAAEGDGCGHTDDVTRADGGGQRGHEGAEGGDVASLLVFLVGCSTLQEQSEAVADGANGQ